MSSTKEKPAEDPVHSSSSSTLASPIIPRRRFILWRLLFRDGPPPLPAKSEVYPMVSASYLLHVLFWFINLLIGVGYQRQLQDEDLYTLDGTDLELDGSMKRLQANLDKRFASFKGTTFSANPTHEECKRYANVLILALNDTFKRRFWIAGAAKVLYDCGAMLNPLLVRALIKFVQRRNTPGMHEPIGRGIGYCIGMACLLVFNLLCMNHAFHYMLMTGGRARTVLTQLAYQKAYRLGLSLRQKYPNGRINLMIMSDLSLVDRCCMYFHFMWSFVVAIAIAIAILVVNLGVSALAGIGVLLFLTMCTTLLTKLYSKRTKATATYVNDRVTAIRELINNIKMVKFYSWEIPYVNRIIELRSKESGMVLRLQMVRGSIAAAVISLPVISAMVAFLTMYGRGMHLDPANVFSSLSLFNVMRQPLMLLPTAINFALDSYAGLGRMLEFFMAPEMEHYVEEKELDDTSAVRITNGNFAWSESSKDGGVPEPLLKDISLDIKKGEFVVVTGVIGSGKTSLLEAIAGNMHQILGSTAVDVTADNGKLIFCLYPWVQNATIRDNITFGLPFLQRRYDATIEACQLPADLAVLPGGDFTEVGERGITLSGGQKARLNLARAVYASDFAYKGRHQSVRHDVLLLDDVLSAVDARVGKLIVDGCLNGLLKNQTRVLATHQLSLIGGADRVVFLNGDGTIDMGTVEELKTRNQGFARLMEFSTEQLEDDESVELLIEEVEEEKMGREMTHATTHATTPEENDKKLRISGRNNLAETRGEGSIPFRVYASYLKMGGGFFGIWFAPLFITTVALCVFCNFFLSVWLVYWMEDKFHLGDSKYVGIYIMICFMVWVLFTCGLVMLAFLNQTALKGLFNAAIQRFIHTPMLFMDLTPTGRVLNRFTKDVDTLDNDNPDQLRLFVNSFLFIIGVLVLAIIYLPWFAIAVPPLLFVFFLAADYYEPSLVDLKRMELLNRLTAYSHLNELLNGIAVIKGYHQEDRFEQLLSHFLDRMNAALFAQFAIQRWLSVRLDVIAALLSLIINLLCATGTFNIGAASAGLVVSYMVQIANMLSLMTRNWTQIESNFNSAERLLEYAYELPEEAEFHVAETAPAELWPQQGSISFDHALLAYRPDLPLVLKEFTAAVGGGEKIGICGRTGAGKSTIMQALFRLTELRSGRIEIDGVDIATLGLMELRSKLSIIPQDPVLFKGTIRQNLDPFGESSDERLWDALRRSWLAEDDSTGGKFHLDQQVEDEGSNFSLGERQLLALARALVRNLRILILDEATSLVDYETDAKIQLTIANEFNHCTILCIAHRLKTILNYDRILVLEQGEIEQFDTPRALYAETEGIFRQMCDRSNINEADF